MYPPCTAWHISGHSYIKTRCTIRAAGALKACTFKKMLEKMLDVQKRQARAAGSAFQATIVQRFQQKILYAVHFIYTLYVPQQRSSVFFDRAVKSHLPEVSCYYVYISSSVMYVESCTSCPPARPPAM